MDHQRPTVAAIAAAMRGEAMRLDLDAAILNIQAAAIRREPQASARLRAHAHMLLDGLLDAKEQAMTIASKG